MDIGEVHGAIYRKLKRCKFIHLLQCWQWHHAHRVEWRHCPKCSPHMGILVQPPWVASSIELGPILDKACYCGCTVDHEYTSLGPVATIKDRKQYYIMQRRTCRWGLIKLRLLTIIKIMILCPAESQEWWQSIWVMACILAKPKQMARKAWFLVQVSAFDNGKVHRDK